MTAAVGYSSRYPPSTAAIAPDAPMLGTSDDRPRDELERRGREAAQEVEEEEAAAPDPVLDVVPEDPQEEHVPEHVRPPAVHEDRREEREEHRHVVDADDGRRPVPELPDVDRIVAVRGTAW